MAPSAETLEELRQVIRELNDSDTGLPNHVKDFVQASKSEYSLYERVRDQFINSPDEDIRKFVTLIQRPFYASSSVLNFVVSIFQLVISAFLLVLGISVISPSILNVSVTQIVQQFAQSTDGGAYLIQAMLFITGLAFVTDAFNHLRSAAFYLRIAGIELQEPEYAR